MTKRSHPSAPFGLIVALTAWALLPLPATAVCVGDCGDDGQVTVDEIIIGVDIALGNAAVDQCTEMDYDGDGMVTVDEIVNAVNAALNGCPRQDPRLIALSREGRIASLDIVAPWTVRASDDLGADISSARCRGGRCLVVHPSTDSISIIDAADLSAADPIIFEREADPRDVALVDDRTAVVSLYGKAELLEIDLVTRQSTTIDLSALADEDGLPEALRLASCGRRVFVQLLRIDHDTQAPAPIGAAVAVIDLDRPSNDRIVDADPVTAGVQGIALADRPSFDMPVDCAAGVLYVAEPKLLMQGGGAYEQVDLEALTASEFPIDTGAEVGGFEVLSPSLYWLITHSTTGPGPSSHLNLFGGSTSETHNTFAREHVNDLALDREEDLLFYPDPCFVSPANPTCDTGIVVFHASTGFRASIEAVDVGFAPIEVVVSR